MPSTPLGPDGAPLRAPSPLIERLLARPRGECAAAARAMLDHVVATPLIEGRARIDGVDCVAVTFVVRHPDPGDQIIVHVNSLTDRLRSALGPAVMARVAGTDLWHLSWWLPASLVASYRLAIGAPLPLDVGREREGWLAVHRRGRPDPLAAHGLVSASGIESSVLVGPDARVDEAWDSPRLDHGRGVDVAADVISDPVLGGKRRLWLRTPPAPSRLVVAFDGDMWHERLRLSDVLDARGDVSTAVAMVESRSPADRGELLTDPDRVSALLEDAVLPVARAATAFAASAEQTIVTGESYGGLAALGVIVTRPDLATRAIAQSPSLHFAASRGHQLDITAPGDLVHRAHEGMSSDVSAFVTWGSEEDHLKESMPALEDAFSRHGAGLEVARYDGGHDYAWWRTGLLDGLESL